MGQGCFESDYVFFLVMLFTCGVFWRAFGVVLRTINVWAVLLMMTTMSMSMNGVACYSYLWSTQMSLSFLHLNGVFGAWWRRE